MTRPVLALDVGGANLKAAHSSGSVRTLPFELWKQPENLPAALHALAISFPPFEEVALTMTGELCDCFATKREGVRQIVADVAAAVDGHPLLVWRTDGSWATAAQARAEPLPCAASNWLALATYAGRLVPAGTAIVVDVGSTTADVIPLVNGVPVPVGRTDVERLRSGELVYTGVRRTPICALLAERGAAEFFATTHDVYLLLGFTPADAADCRTADGRPATRAFAHARLARMIGGDAESCPIEEMEQLAREIHERQLGLLRSAVDVVCGRLPEPPRLALISGSGEFLARLAVARKLAVFSLRERFGAEVSEAVCAHALAQLAVERQASDA